MQALVINTCYTNIAHLKMILMSDILRHAFLKNSPVCVLTESYIVANFIIVYNIYNFSYQYISHYSLVLYLKVRYYTCIRPRVKTCAAAGTIVCLNPGQNNPTILTYLTRNISF